MIYFVCVNYILMKQTFKFRTFIEDVSFLIYLLDNDFVADIWDCYLV